jgi:TatD DNase family protein
MSGVEPEYAKGAELNAVDRFSTFDPRMTEFYDTHAHLDFPDFEADLPEVVARAERAGITRIVTIGTTLEGSRRAVGLAERFPGVFAAVGVHPGHVDESPDEIRDSLRRLAAHPKVVAIGETGLDFFRRPGAEPVPEEVAAINRRRQESLFRQQLEVAGELGLPVVVHTRDSFRPTMDLLGSSGAGIRAVFHCWVGSLDEAQTVVASGSLVSFTGIATFKNGAAIRAVAAALPAGTFQLETDCPFLAPVPHRGRRCEPAHVAELAPVIAEARGVSLEALSRETCGTARRFFHRMA